MVVTFSFLYLLFVSVLVYFVLKKNLNNKSKESKIDSEEGILSDKNQNESISILRNEAIALVNILYNQSLLSLKQTTEKKDEINKIDEQDSLNNIIKDLKQKVEQFEKEVKEKKAQLDTQQMNISKGEFIINTLLSILSPVIYFIITFYIAIEVEDYFIQTGAGPFDLEDTWWIWTIYLIVVFLIEKKLFSIRKRSKYFKSNVFRVLYYLSTFSTIAG